MTGTGAYLAVFLLMTLTFIGVPAVGPAIVGWAAVQASQGELNIVLVQQDWQSLVALVAGLAIAAGCAVLAARYYHRRRVRRLAGRASASEADGDGDDTPGHSPGRGDVPRGSGREVAVTCRSGWARTAHQGGPGAWALATGSPPGWPTAWSGRRGSRCHDWRGGRSG
jgi:hypothetical protein